MIKINSWLRNFLCSCSFPPHASRRTCERKRNFYRAFYSANLNGSFLHSMHWVWSIRLAGTSHVLLPINWSYAALVDSQCGAISAEQCVSFAFCCACGMPAGEFDLRDSELPVRMGIWKQLKCECVLSQLRFVRTWQWSAVKVSEDSAWRISWRVACTSRLHLRAVGTVPKWAIINTAALLVL